MHAWFAKSRDDAWVHTTLEELVAEWLGTAPERITLTLQDLLALPPIPSVVAEGHGFLPELVTPLISSPHKAVRLVPTEEFKRASHERRQKGAFLADRSDPERAVRNHIGRDLLIGAHVRRSALALGQTVVEVDGTRSLGQLIDLVDAHFAPHRASLAGS